MQDAAAAAAAAGCCCVRHLLQQHLVMATVGGTLQQIQLPAAVDAAAMPQTAPPPARAAPVGC